MKELKEAWEISNRINLDLIASLGKKELGTTLSTRGGRTVGEQFLHLHKNRIVWMQHAAKSLFEEITKEALPDPQEKNELKNALNRSAQLISELIQLAEAKNGKITGFKKNSTVFIAYLIAHEAHHRGNILLTLKHSGFKLPDTVKWKLWEWDK